MNKFAACVYQTVSGTKLPNAAHVWEFKKATKLNNKDYEEWTPYPKWLNLILEATYANKTNTQYFKNEDGEKYEINMKKLKQIRIDQKKKVESEIRRIEKLKTVAKKPKPPAPKRSKPVAPPPKRDQPRKRDPSIIKRSKYSDSSKLNLNLIKQDLLRWRVDTEYDIGEIPSRTVKLLCKKS
eukprot:UN24910